MSQLFQIHGNSTLIVCFAGLYHRMGGIGPFEFFNFLTTEFGNKYDCAFYRDTSKSWYQRGFPGHTKTIDESINHLNNLIADHPYTKVVFMGVSLGGYAAILFGSLCKGVTDVIAFIPQTHLRGIWEASTHVDLLPHINPHVSYLLYGASGAAPGAHHISHCTRLEHLPNVKVRSKPHVDVKSMRDSGELLELMQEVLQHPSAEVSS